MNPDVVFLAGLLHDIGRLVLASHYPVALAALRRQAGQYGSLDEAEREVLGLDHAEIGARLAQHWAFPEPIVRTIWFHHRPALAPAEHRDAAWLVSVAESICAGDPAIDLQEGLALDAGEALHRLGMAPDARAALIEDARAEAVRAAASLDVLG